jgi:hypothetical protein
MNLPYTYFVQNIITNQFYYGSRYKNTKLGRSAKEDFWIHYFTSSKEIKQLIKDFGKDSFNISILLESENYDNCYWYEQILIEKNIINPLCLNRYYRNKEGSCKFSTAGVIMTRETKEKIGRRAVGRVMPESVKIQISITTLGEKENSRTYTECCGRKKRKEK